MLLWIWLAVALVMLVLYLQQKYSKLSSRGVKHLPTVPIFGNMARVIFKQEHFVNCSDKIYKKLPEERFLGFYQFFDSVIIIRDLELIKRVAIKDIEHFLDHRLFVNRNVDPLFGSILFFLTGNDWKDMRGTLGPVFTSSKIRAMVPFIVEVGDQMTQVLAEKFKATNDDYIDIDVKDFTTRYANDVIATCAFGLKVNSQKELDNEFYLRGKEASTVTFSQSLLLFANVFFPKVMSVLKINLFSEKINNFFRSIVTGNMKDREERNIVRPDLIQLLMDVKKGVLSYNEKAAADTDAGFATVEESSLGKKQINRAWTDDDLTAQALVFFIAGFETVSSVMSFLLYELAVNPDVQEKLYHEIKKTEEKYGGKIDYSILQEMKYMDMVISETLRKWPPVVAGDRICTKDYNLGKPNDKVKEDYIIRKGEAIHIPIWSLHHDPQYFADPEKFNPERFSDQNKHNINPLTYLPFGIGPRNCIGSRFALCEMKAMAYQLLRNMELSPGAKTRIPAKIAADSVNLKIEGGHWVRFRPRS